MVRGGANLSGYDLYFYLPLLLPALGKWYMGRVVRQGWNRKSFSVIASSGLHKVPANAYIVR